MDSFIDLRSDTVTLPTNAMRQAMMSAEVGDDVYGDDPSVNRLEALAAEQSGKEAALFAPSGTQTNLLALLAHCQRGDEYIAGEDAHTYLYEAGGAAVLGSIQPCTIPFDSQGCLPLALVAKKIKPKDPHFARTRLLCLENTQHGRVLPLDYLEQAQHFCQQHGLALHLDGARVFNAASKLNVPLERITRHVDSVSVCLSKGLCAPMGSVLCGDKGLIGEARRYRKMLGGGMRQAGFMAAAGIVALTQMPQQLHLDHQRAEALAEALEGIEGLHVRAGWTQTNLVWLDFDRPIGSELKAFCRARGLLIGSGETHLRLALHHQIRDEDVARAASILSAFFHP